MAIECGSGDIYQSWCGDISTVVRRYINRGAETSCSDIDPEG